MFPNHALIAVEGTIPGAAPGDNAEIFQFGVRVLGAGGGYVDDPQAAVEEIAGPLAAWFGGVENQISGYAELQTVKLNNIAPDGKYNSPNTFRHDYQPAVLGGAPYPQLPFCCVAWSWGTGIRRGLASHGRIYPPNHWTTSGGENIGSDQQNAHRDAALSFLTLISNTDGDHPLTPAVVSRVGSGVARPISEVRIGAKVDSQRRRKNEVPENYLSAPFPT